MSAMLSFKTSTANLGYGGIKGYYYKIKESILKKCAKVKRKVNAATNRQIELEEDSYLHKIRKICTIHI